MIDAIVVAAVVVAVVLVVRARVRAGAKGGCSGCGSASVCAGSVSGPCPVAGDAVESMEEAARAAVASVKPAGRGRSCCH